MMKKAKKRGQLEIGFNWIYILIAGAVILMFFIGITFKQKAVSEQKLSATVLKELEGIFTGASLSEQTFTPVDVPLIELAISCDEATGYSEYNIKGAGVRVETPWQPIFAPEVINSQKLYTWTLEWQMPFKAANYLFVSAPNIKYYIFSDEIKLPDQFNWVKTGVNNYAAIGYNNEEQVRLVFFENMPLNEPLPRSLWPVDDKKVTAVEFSLYGINFYRKNGRSWDKINAEAIPLVDSFSTENPNIYGAIFSTSPDTYQCNLKKAFRRLGLVNQIYWKRAEELGASATKPECAVFVSADNFKKINETTQICQQTIGPNCGRDLYDAAFEVERDNEEASTILDCPVIY